MPNDTPSEENRDPSILGGCLDELSGHVNSWLDEFRSRAGTLTKALERTRKQVRTLEHTEPPAAGRNALPELAALARDVECTSDQAKMLDLLMSRTAPFAPRCVLFVVRPDAFSGWAVRGIDTKNPKSITVPADADTILKRTLSRCEPSREAAGARKGNKTLVQPLGPTTPQEMAAAPIWVKDKVVGILYADTDRPASGWHPEGIFLAATLVALGLEALPLRVRQPRPLPPPEPPREEVEEDPFAVSHEVEDPPDHIEVIEVMDTPDEPEADEEIIPSPDETLSTTNATGAEETAEADTELIEPEPELMELDDQPIADLEPELIEPEPEMTAQAAASQTVEMSAAASAPPSAGTADDPMHTEAKRFARLLVSEILLYNEKQVQEGRLKKDLYERLKEDIERSRQMYDERIATRLPDAARYFREELINSIADGDESAMKIPWG